MGHKRMFEQLKEVAVPLIIGAAGGVVNIGYTVKKGQTVSVGMCLLNITTSAVVGVTAFWLAKGTGLNESLCAASSALGGMLGTRAVDYAEIWLRKKGGIE